MNLRAVLAFILVAGSLPFAAASGHVASGDIDGRTILFDLTQYDPDLAAVAGHARETANWFDGTFVVDKGSKGFVYAVPAGTDDPTGKPLFPTGDWYNFTDDNGATWHVREWYYLDVQEVQYMLGGHAATEKIAHKVHVWTVETLATPIVDADQDLTYNFVVVVDVTKLEPVLVEGDGTTSDPSSSSSSSSSSGPSGSGAGNVDIHFSRKDPVRRCVGCSVADTTA